MGLSAGARLAGGLSFRFYSLPFPGYDVSADGQRFFVTQAVPSPPLPPVTHIHLVQNWLEELKAKVPVK